ncbi:MAG: glutathione S-transferase family protein [Deltaproteobacteria bacterium]|nr:glutathione S-transferase family protein [Deltaproteobacteria bacterium]
MAKPKLTYFDAPTSRGEECRLALHLAGVEFDDNRIQRDAWPALKPTTPFGSLPTLEWPGHPTLAQSNAILALIGRLHGLHPKDEFEAARHEAVMAHVEDLRAHVSPTLRVTDPDEKKRAREQLAATYLPAWAAYTDRQISDDGPFFAGSAVHVIDVKLLVIVRWFRSGVLDHVPTNVFDGAPKLLRVHDAVDAHPRVRDWYARTRR